jgi:hypothetical protein
MALTQLLTEALFSSCCLEALFNCPVLGAVVVSFYAGSFHIFDEAAIRADFGVTILVADKGCKKDRVAAWAPALKRSHGDLLLWVDKPIYCADGHL